MKIYANGSISKFMDISAQSSGYVDNDVVNMKTGGAVKAGTFHSWNIFRRLFRTKEEVRQNNSTRQQLLDSLKETFGLKETGPALVRRLTTILGENVLKPNDFSFDKNGHVNCGQPLTARRIRAIAGRINFTIESHLKVLGLTKNATMKEAKAAYRRIVFENHPDKLGGLNLPEDEKKMRIDQFEKAETSLNYLRDAFQAGLFDKEHYIPGV